MIEEKETPYSNREIREKWNEIANALQRIEIQTTTTNGKVAELQMWRYLITGGIAVLTAILLPLMAWALWRLVELQSTVKAVVDLNL